MFQLETIDNISKNIALKLLDNQTLLKLLYYNVSDALLQPDLTDEQRYELIDQSNTDKTKIYYSPYSINILVDEVTQLRIILSEIQPENIQLANVLIDFQIITHNRLWVMEDGRQRPLVMIQEILKMLNGQDAMSIGTLFFGGSKRIPTRLIKYNNDFSGYIMTMGTRST